jgi:hypothetical protein
MDGVEWEVLIPLLRQNRLPALAEMMRGGRYGYLRSFAPTESPAIWTSVATGKTPDKHGILEFTYSVDGGHLRLYKSTDRRTKAIWNIASDYGKRVCVVGWWMTYPVEPVNGFMVAQTNTDAQLRAGNWRGTLLEGVAEQVYPPERQPEIMELFEEVSGNLGARVQRLFGGLEYPDDSWLERRLVENSLWSFRSDAACERIARNLTRQEGPFDLTLFYLGGPDVVSHRFWRYRQPELYANTPTEERVEAFGELIDDYYVYADEALGKLRQYLPEETTVIVVSDHGMKPGNLDGEFGPNTPPMFALSALHDDAPPGVFFAEGPLVKAADGETDPASVSLDSLEIVGSVLDITPTVLRLMNIPAGEDMDGEVLDALFRVPSLKDAALPTHDTPEFFDTRTQVSGADSTWMDERIEQLRSLGYIDE